jgi:hypothetical protein
LADKRLFLFAYYSIRCQSPWLIAQQIEASGVIEPRSRCGRVMRICRLANIEPGNKWQDLLMAGPGERGRGGPVNPTSTTAQEDFIKNRLRYGTIALAFAQNRVELVDPTTMRVIDIRQ